MRWRLGTAAQVNDQVLPMGTEIGDDTPHALDEGFIPSKTMVPLDGDAEGLFKERFPHLPVPTRENLGLGEADRPDTTLGKTASPPFVDDGRNPAVVYPNQPDLNHDPDPRVVESGVGPPKVPVELRQEKAEEFERGGAGANKPRPPDGARVTPRAPSQTVLKAEDQVRPPKPAGEVKPATPPIRETIDITSPHKPPGKAETRDTSPGKAGAENP